MRRIQIALLVIAVLAIAGQVVYFCVFGVRAPRYSEGHPLVPKTVSEQVPNICTLYNDGTDHVWIGNQEGSIYILDAATDKVQPVTTPQEVSDSRIRSLLTDRCGRLWVGTSRAGLFIRSGDDWKSYDVGQRVGVIKAAPDGDQVLVASEKGLFCYDLQSDTWSDIALSSRLPDTSAVGDEAKSIPAEQGEEVSGGEMRMDYPVQPTAIAFGMDGTLYVGTSCEGIIQCQRDDAGIFRVVGQTRAKRRYGPGSSPCVSPVPLDACGEGLPSNLINDVLVGADGTVWVATTAGLAWSRDNGASWFFLRGRNYGEKMRGLLAGTPHGWKELPRIRFGELLPEDDIAVLQQDTFGTLWIGTRSLGCIAIRPEAFYQTTTPISDSLESQQKFLEEMAANATRFHGTRVDQITAMSSLSEGTVLLASRIGPLEKIACPGEWLSVEKPVVTKTQNDTSVTFPAVYVPAVSVESNPTEPSKEERIYPNAVVLTDDYVTGSQWEGKYGRTYSLVGGGNMPHDAIVAFDETLCKIRPFVGNIGNRTRPLERVSLSSCCSHHKEEHHEHADDERLTAWSCYGNAVPKTVDGQHLWFEMTLVRPGYFRVDLFFIDMDAQLNQIVKAPEVPRDYVIEIFAFPTPGFFNADSRLSPEAGGVLTQSMEQLKRDSSTSPVMQKTRIPKGDWQEAGKRVDEWASVCDPLAVTRVMDFPDGVHKRFMLAGPGTYYLRVAKNYSRKIDLCAVLVDRSEGDPTPEWPSMTPEQTSDDIP
ncbi:MAG: two-component regulator propeller domain-containing protein [Planctomycetia bacterium]|nr:two-component regulator propeller domain-containing protein [Planctomycetia bacterium]